VGTYNLMEFVVMCFLLALLDQFEALVALVGHSAALGLVDAQLGKLNRSLAIEARLLC
jgi:hypothetical protein